jgi:hypothetical protein
VAIEPDTTLPGMITEIDHRYFKRVILPKGIITSGEHPILLSEEDLRKAS